MHKQISPNIELHLLSPNTPDFFSRISSAKGIFVGSENSMIDVDKIDEFYKGKVGPESVDLDKMTGNSRVLSLLEIMKENKKAAFFPGTLLRNYGGYSLPVMPIIVDGKIVREQVKQDGIFYDDEVELGRHLLGDDFAEKVKRSSGDYFDEPLKTLQSTLMREVKDRRAACLSPIKIKGYNVLPVICSDLSAMAKNNHGNKVDLIVHSCTNYFKNNEERIELYNKYLGKMAKRDNLANEVLIATSERGDFLDEFASFKGIFSYSRNKLSVVKQECF
ncbi:MAG: hypothetical protein AABW82_02990 [Nanoarchaeota archaeon]